jgi:hypothetical protein
MEDIKANRNCLNQNSQNLQDYQNKTKDEFTYKIIGCAMRVQYQRSLAIELGEAKARQELFALLESGVSLAEAKRKFGY